MDRPTPGSFAVLPTPRLILAAAITEKDLFAAIAQQGLTTHAHGHAKRRMGGYTHDGTGRGADAGRSHGMSNTAISACGLIRRWKPIGMRVTCTNSASGRDGERGLGNWRA